MPALLNPGIELRCLLDPTVLKPKAKEDVFCTLEGLF